jgi:hypothetical protein
MAYTYKWIAGMEGTLNRRLVSSERPNARLGTCVTNLIEKDGSYSIGADAGLVLRPFFEEVDRCGAVRPQSA